MLAAHKWVAENPGASSLPSLAPCSALAA
jgi:hypothetical protein